MYVSLNTAPSKLCILEFEWVHICSISKKDLLTDADECCSPCRIYCAKLNTIFLVAAWVLVLVRAWQLL
jgi:hypothetical protein